MYQFYDPDTVHSLPISSKIESERSDNNMFEFEISGIHVFVTGAQNGKVPCVIYNSDQNDGLKVYEEIQKITDIPFTFAVLSGFNWNDDLSPWPMKSFTKWSADFAGNADDYLNVITEQILPEISRKLSFKPAYYALTGYSLAGLFAVYSLYKTDVFKRAAVASGSLWYENFITYAKTQKMAAKPDAVYFSLGDRESRTKNEIMRRVEDNTAELCEFYKSLGIQSVFELNPGGHFQDCEKRMAKGIAWILK